MEIREAIIQGIIKETGSTTTAEAFRETPSPVDERMSKLGDELLKIYGKLTNNYGRFDLDRETYPFAERLRAHLAGELSLVDFSQSTTRLIASRMQSSPAATGGYVLQLKYKHQGRDWLLIVMLKLKNRTGLDLTSLELNDSLSFDIDHLHEAARVDLEKWQNDVQPYLSFIKRSGRQDEVTKYFRMALGCTEYTDSKSHTDQVLKALEAYGIAEAWPNEKRADARKKAYEHFSEKSDKHEPVNLVTLSAIINDQAPDAFISFAKDNGYQINETFEPHKKTYSKLKRISEKFGNINISFDVQDVVDGTIAVTDNQIIIRNPPNELIERIIKEQSDDGTD